jgi:hypothetical protein
MPSTIEGEVMRRRVAMGAAFVASLVFLVPGAATAKGDSGGGPVLSEPIATGLVGPLQLAVDGDDVYVAQAFAGLVTKLAGDGSRTDFPVPGLSGLEVDGRRVLYSTRDGEPGAEPASAVFGKLNSDGSTTVIADILAYERAANPDQGNVYGVESISDDCAALWPVATVGPPQYPGQIDSNPYGIAAGDGGTYIADAGGNAILEVSRRGKVRTVAVLPPQPAVITAEAAAANGLPGCAVGLTYNFEPVPTDVEVGRGGVLYVTLLPGGPEDPSLGARGSVVRINPRSGSVKPIASGLLGAANLAIGKGGTIYVAELFGGRIMRIGSGGNETVAELPLPAGLEYADGKLYVSYDALPGDGAPPDGKVATIELGRR